MATSCGRTWRASGIAHSLFQHGLDRRANAPRLDPAREEMDHGGAVHPRPLRDACLGDMSGSEAASQMGEMSSWHHGDCLP
jgi:hypothetical protein